MNKTQDDETTTKRDPEEVQSRQKKNKMGVAEKTTCSSANVMGARWVESYVRIERKVHHPGQHTRDLDVIEWDIPLMLSNAE